MEKGEAGRVREGGRRGQEALEGRAGGGAGDAVLENVEVVEGGRK